MIKAVIFDLGNVICSFDNDKIINRFASYSNKCFDEIKRLVYSPNTLPRQYETGELSSEEFYIKMKEMCNLDVSLEQFAIDYSDIFTTIPETVELIKKLKGRYKLALLSNTGPWHYEREKREIEELSLLDTITVSYEVGVMKPDEKIFRDALRKLELKPQECIFIDDVEEYVKAALRLGINGIQYVSPEKLLSDLEKLGVDF